MNLKLQIIQNAVDWNKNSRQGRTAQAVLPMNDSQINKLKKASLNKITDSGIKVKFGTGNNSFDLSKLKITFKKDEDGKDTSEILNVIGSELGIPTPTSPSLRFLTCRESTDLQKKDPVKNVGKRLKNKAGPLAAMWIVHNFNCEYKTKKFQFGLYEDVTTDHKISQRKLILGYLLGIISKNNYQDRNNLCLMRGKKNVGKGCRSFYERTKKTNYNLDEALNKLNKYLKSNEGQFLLSLRKENRSWANSVVKLALWYKGHQICKTSFYQKNKVEKGSFVIAMITKHHRHVLKGIYIDPYVISD